MKKFLIGAVSAFALTAGAAFAEPDTKVQMFDGAQIAPDLTTDLANLDEPMFPGAETGDAEATTYVTFDMNSLNGVLPEPAFAMTDGGSGVNDIGLDDEMAYVTTTPSPAPMVADDTLRVFAYGPEAEFDGLSGDLIETASADSLAVGAAEFGPVFLASFDPTMGIGGAIFGSGQAAV